jgi:hypothetical protein
VTVKGAARATIESFTTVNGINVMPWGVLKASYVPNQPYAIYTKDTANANNGALSLPYVQSTTCPVPNGSSVYSDEIAGTTPVCPVSVGESLNTDPGNNSGPTSQGLNIRITNWQTVDQIVQFTVLEQRRQAGERRVREPRQLGHHGHARAVRPQLQHRLHGRAHPVALSERVTRTPPLRGFPDRARRPMLSGIGRRLPRGALRGLLARDV